MPINQVSMSRITDAPSLGIGCACEAGMSGNARQNRAVIACIVVPGLSLLADALLSDGAHGLVAHIAVD